MLLVTKTFMCTFMHIASKNEWRDFDETKYLPLLKQEVELLQKYNKIWEKSSNCIKKGLDNEPVYNDKVLITIIKSYERKINPCFHNDKILKEGSQCICLSGILIDSVFRRDKNYYYY